MALPLLEHANDLHSLADAYKRMGHVFLRVGNQSKARQHYKKSRALYKGLDKNDLYGEADCLVGLANVELAGQNLSGAQALISKARKVYEKLDAMYGVANCDSASGEISSQQNDLDTAFEFYERAKKKYERTGFSLGSAVALTNWALSRNVWEDCNSQ
jgi:tetratricopeptide (TPR) repeat protein